ncbi:TGS domain-containing protein [Candidatus Bathyarchaeota archaeon]|nr:TGS domain-containing protein [Candidatus Bathyarchaeota archaeon]MBT4319824.1 TGS domain-containing protein [Candidatus Bathyarchaeota archaeon]MBT4425197.1 TGS domain-containing protein [Candidatus Bathyarchaeota archaeon]MBT5642525.1 TGS domain-containing protein [Candidatus Bathyarchaeota archaeon]MBT6605603.1 TGS domain-containing protein [Candidatus Bathyarchaeota archaeon]
MTNLPPEAKKKWMEVTMTKNPETKLPIMQEFLSMVPKHKGTDKMCSQIKRQISQLKEDIKKQKQQAKKTSTGPSYYVQKAGAAQVAIVGTTNTGRSSLLKAVTNSQVPVTSWPFGTMMPTPGMLDFEDIQFQLVEIPPIVQGSSEGKAEGFMNLSSARNADGLIIMVDLADDPAGNFLLVKEELENTRLLIVPPTGEVEIQKRGSGNKLQFIMEGELVDCSEADITELLAGYRIRSALVRIKGKVTLDLVEDSMFGNAVYRPTMVIANKVDLNNDPRMIEQLVQATYPLQLHVMSIERMKDLAGLIGQSIFDLLGITRIYTKEPGKPKRNIPIVSKPGTTVGELAKMIHNDFYDRFKYAKIWGPSAKFDSEKVGMDRVLLDGSVIQIYT